MNKPTIVMSTTREESSAGLARVNIDAIAKFWSITMRCHTGPDLFRVVKFTENGMIDVQKGRLPVCPEDDTSENKKKLVPFALKMEELLRNNAPAAFNTIKKTFNFYDATASNGRAVAIYAKCQDGLIAVAWHNDGDLHKAKSLAYFTLYMLGAINAENDPVLWDAAYTRLPYRRRFDREAADKIYGEFYSNLGNLL